jgi:hypothetical protein
MHYYDLAFTLGRTRNEIDNMDYEEIQGWFEYFQRRPIGWREDLRAAYIMNSNGVDKKPEELFPAIKQIKNDERKVQNTGHQGEALMNSNFGAMLASKGFRPKIKK